jgi:hypothetical protein
MANTPIYGFETPDDTDLVKDGALAIRTALDDVDTTLGTALNSNDYAGLVLVKKQTVGTGVTSVSVSDAFSATYENYLIQYTGGVISQPIVDFGLALNGITSGYNGSLTFITWASAAFNGANYVNGANWQWAGSGSTSGAVINTTICQPFLTKPKTITNTLISVTSTGGGGTMAGNNMSTASATGFTISVGTGTITGGTIYVYGYGTS